MSKKKKTPSPQPQDIVQTSRQKAGFFENFYENMAEMQDKLSIEEITLMKQAFEVYSLHAEQIEEERKKREDAEREHRRRLAKQKKREREEARRQARLDAEEAERHRQHVEEVTSWDLPIDFENAFSGEGITGTAETVSDALVLSLERFACVDIEYISELSGKSFREVISELKGSIYQNPETWGECFWRGWETSDEYLSGNILYKLGQAREANEEFLGYFADNVAALEGLLSPNVATEDIYVTLGSPWVPPDVIDDFILSLAGVSPDSDEAKAFADEKYKVRHDEYTGLWEIPEKTRFRRSASQGRYEEINCSAYGTDRMEMLFILENTLNQRSVQITDGIDTGKKNKNGKPIIKRIVNNDETIKVVERQERLVRVFQDWIWTDEARKTRLQAAYCSKFGNVKRRVYSGDFLRLPGLSSQIELYKHQKDAVARILFSPNTLLAHDVGAGKTYIMIAAGMELRRLGKSKKNLYVVPNNILGQWRSNFLKMYPSANILVVDKKNFKPSKRTETLMKIKDGDYDAILMAYSSFDMLSLSKKFYIDQYNKHLEMLAKAKKRFAQTGKIEMKIKHIQDVLKKLAEEVPKQVCSIPFDDLGINTLFLDEAHYYKNVPIDSAIHLVQGINKSGSDKCLGMMDKIHCIQRDNNGGRIIFATGTPITNSLTDIFAIQKYLQSGELEFAGIHNFDNWVGMFAEKTTEYEIDVDTNSYRLKTRFAKFKNLPELTSLLSSVADFHFEKHDDELPAFDGYTDSVSTGSNLFRDYLKSISTRADDVRNKRVTPDVDNMLKITSDGRKAALDMRLVDRYFGREAESKVMRCAEQITDIYYDTREERGVQLVFCDISTPKEGFNLYDELKNLLIAMGIPGDQIAFIHDAASDAAKEELFHSLRKGEKSVIIGSTFKTGHGVNIQERLVALHHLDVPWRPADMVQREGRILRRGNTSKRVRIFRYITRGSFDAYSWQLLEGKQRFISQILSGTCTQRECGDVDETVLNYAEVKALAVGNPKIKRRVEVSNELSRYLILEREEHAKRETQREEIAAIPNKIKKWEKRIALCGKDIAETDLVIAAELAAENEKKRLKEERRAALNAKNVARDKAKEAERAWKHAETAAKRAEAKARKKNNRDLTDEAVRLRAEADRLYAAFQPLADALADARESVKGARELVAESEEDTSVLQKLRTDIATAARVHVGEPTDTEVATYRSFRIIIPANMKPRPVKERGEDGKLVESDKKEPFICLAKNGRYYLNIGDEFGILRRMDNVIDNLRGERAKMEERVAQLRVRSQALKEDLGREDHYGEEIERLRKELDELDEELGLKVAS